jgi:hypothetical protein
MNSITSLFLSMMIVCLAIPAALAVTGATAQGARERAAEIRYQEKSGTAKLNGAIFRANLKAAAKACPNCQM